MRKKTISVRIGISTHHRLLHMKHHLVKETFDESINVLLDEHESREKGAQRP